jgi:hypothetical protein
MAETYEGKPCRHCCNTLRYRINRHLVCRHRTDACGAAQRRYDRRYAARAYREGRMWKQKEPLLAAMAKVEWEIRQREQEGY